MNYKVKPNLYTKKYYLLDDYQGARYYKNRILRLVPAVEKIYRKIKTAASGQRFLDAGCGKGELLYFMARKNYKVFGIDYSKAAIKMSTDFLNYHKTKATVFIADVRKIPFEGNFFDIVISTDVIEHLDDNQAVIQFLREMYRVLKPMGKLYIHTAPNKLYVEYFLKYYQRYINYVIFKILNIFRSSDNKIKPTLEIRGFYHKKFHVNEQTPFSLRANFKSSPFKKYSIEVFSDPFEFNLFKLPYYVLGYFYPINKIFPFNLFLGCHLYAEAEK